MIETGTSFVRTTTGIEPFSLGRLVGDLILCYQMQPDLAKSVAKTLQEVMAVLRETSGITTLDTYGIRKGIEELLQGRSLSEVSGMLAPGQPNVGVRPGFPVFTRVPDTDQVLMLNDSAASYATHLLAEASMGTGSEKLVEDVGRLLEEVENRATAGTRGKEELAGAVGKLAADEAKHMLARGFNKQAEENFEIDIRKILRWLADLLRVIPESIGEGASGGTDEPRTQPLPPTFGKQFPESGWHLQQDLLMWTAERLTDGKGADDMRLSGFFNYLGQRGPLNSAEETFASNGKSQPGNNRMLSRVNLVPAIQTCYVAMHVLSEQDVADEEQAKRLAALVESILSEIASGVLSAAMNAGASATGIPGAGVITGALQQVVFGPVLSKAGDIVSQKLRQLLERAFGPEVFLPAPAVVAINWSARFSALVPEWFVWVQGYPMQATPVRGKGEVRTQRQPNGMPYTVQIGGPGRYSYQFRFRVD